jgi:autotransporter-associated beta strand protein
MIGHPKAFNTAALMAAVCLLSSWFLAFPARAQLYWDIDAAIRGATPGNTAVGIWGVDNYWTTSRQGNRPTQPWTPGEQAIFSAGSDATGTFTIGVSGNQIASGIVFQEGTITLTNGTITLTDGRGNATLQVNSGRTATIASQIAGNDGLTKEGSGTLILSGANTYSGITDLRAGLLLIGNSFALGTSTLNLSGGTIGASAAAQDLPNTVNINANTSIGGSVDITFSGNISKPGSSRTLTVNNTGTTTFSGSTLTLGSSGSDLTFNITGGGVIIASSVRNGSGNNGLIKNGSGSLTLSGNNTFSGGLSVLAGTVVLGSDTAGGSGTISFSSGVTVAGAGGNRIISNNLSIGGNITFSGTSLTFSDSFNLGGPRTFTVENTTTMIGRISGSGNSLTKSGDGTLILTASNTFGGSSSTFTINSGTVAFGHNNAGGNSGNTLVLNGGRIEGYADARVLPYILTIAGNSTIGGSQNLTFTGPVNHAGGANTLTVNNTGLTTFSGSTFSLANANMVGTLTMNVSGASGGVVINNVLQNGTGSGADSLVKTGAGTLTLGGSSANTFTGGFPINAGTVNAAKVNALGTGSLTIGNATLNIGAYNQTVGTVTLAGGIINGTSGRLTGTSYQMQSGTVNATLAGTASLNKTTVGTLTLNSPSIYSGGSTLNGGSVFVNNITGSGTGTGAVTVNNSATLGGTGNILGQITLNSGASLAPGPTTVSGIPAPGTLTTVNQTWNSNSRLTLGINDVDAGAGIGWSSVNIAGRLTVNASSNNPIFVDICSLDLGNSPGLIHDFDNTREYSWSILSASDGILFNPGQSADTAFTVVLDRFQNDLGGGRFTLGTENGNLMLYFTQVPEPGSRAMLVLGFLILLARNHFRGWSKPAQKK